MIDENKSTDAHESKVPEPDEAEYPELTEEEKRVEELAAYVHKKLDESKEMSRSVKLLKFEGDGGKLTEIWGIVKPGVELSDESKDFHELTSEERRVEELAAYVHRKLGEPSEISRGEPFEEYSGEISELWGMVEQRDESLVECHKHRELSVEEKRVNDLAEYIHKRLGEAMWKMESDSGKGEDKKRENTYVLKRLEQLAKYINVKLDERMKKTRKTDVLSEQKRIIDLAKIINDKLHVISEEEIDDTTTDVHIQELSKDLFKSLLEIRQEKANRIKKEQEEMEMRKLFVKELLEEELTTHEVQTVLRKMDEPVKPLVPEETETMSSELGKLKLLSTATPPSSPTEPGVPAHPVDSRTRQFQWEQGQIDYLGEDRFENIKKKLDEKINNGP
uniref:Glycogenin-1-like isoform X1 n=1 Tax=Saccoglossus kowalevskii TaxID=10224 RepID=A0ABM0LZR2_SACKO|nr:PREDICTED: glycogenin-1-like isoform X1 [Saccoglossus kowalevskii]